MVLLKTMPQIVREICVDPKKSTGTLVGAWLGEDLLICNLSERAVRRRMREREEGLVRTSWGAATQRTSCCLVCLFSRSECSYR